ncbi:MAG: hypothetical protein WCW65_00040 [Candidatus Paceibacterota bacterium]
MKTLVIVLLSVLVLSLAGMGWFAFNKNSEAKILKTEKAEAVALAHENDSIASANKELADRYSKEATEYSELYDKATEELDTIRPLALATDSIKAVAADLQKQLAIALATAKRSPSPKADAAVTAIQKKLKGNPITDDANRTFTYVASDEALVATMAPAGYKLIKKPR